VNFQVLKQAVAKQFERLQANAMFRVAVDKDALYATYLGSFPEGTNPLYRERTEHDCSCCKQFIRAVGDAVAIIDGKLETIWDVKVPAEPGYQAVADALAAFVRSHKIANPFLHYERSAGTSQSFEQLTTGVKTWDHFHVNIKPQYVMKNADIASALGEQRAVRDVFMRSLTEITDDAIETVQELMANRSLYRGDEKKFIVETFAKVKKQFNKLKTDAERELFAWSQFKTIHVSVAKIRNDAIGVLLDDLTNGMELEHAVKKWEVQMAPANYKRPTALVTKAMIEKAKKTVEELGLTSALQRRYATIHDITINNILFANREAKKAINGDVFDELTATASSKIKNLDKVEEVPIDKFLTDILPRAKSIEVMLENRHANNLVSLIAPADPTAGNMFKWDNKFSWSYNGDMADSIKERVKQAGGNVSGDLCCRLAWFNHDDLDFHMTEPGGYKIYFGSRGHTSPGGGRLDVDMNAGMGTTRTPVENIFYESKRKMKEGTYLLQVNQYNRRESKDIGFEVEIDFLGNVHRFVYDKAVSGMITVAKFKYSHANGIEFLEALPSTQASKEVWNIPSQTFHKVNVLMMSPNFWDEKAVGNKHYFFMLDGCRNDGTARGFFNEFLKPDLDKHRKVFEMIGNKLKTDESDEQLSGLGFSSTQRNDLIVKVEGSFTRTIKIVF